MDIKTFQMIAGLKPDGIAGPKTQVKAKEFQQVINQIIKKDKVKDD